MAKLYFAMWHCEECSDDTGTVQVSNLLFFCGEIATLTARRSLAMTLENGILASCRVLKSM